MFAVCCPFLFVVVVNEMDRGLDLFSCLYLIPFGQLFFSTVAVTSQQLEGSYKIESFCAGYRSSALGVFFHLDHCFFFNFPLLSLLGQNQIFQKKG